MWNPQQRQNFHRKKQHLTLTVPRNIKVDACDELKLHKKKVVPLKDSRKLQIATYYSWFPCA